MLIYKKHIVYLFIGSLILLSSCARIPSDTHTKYLKIETGNGPEDIILDTLSMDSARLFISCNDHRLLEKAAQGEIYVMNLDRDSSFAEIMPRTGEPEGLDFHPHGVDLVLSDSGQVYLYVISHNDLAKKHYVYQYEVLENQLVFKATYENQQMHSPNSVCAMPNGDFYITNDAGKRHNKLEAFLKLRKGSIVLRKRSGDWVKVADKLAYPNGLATLDQHYLFVSTTRQQHIFRYVFDYEGNLIDKTKLGKVLGGDNIRFAGDGFLVSSHARIFAFLGHLNKAHKKSPSIIYQIDPSNGHKKVIYANDGTQISACSVGIIYKNFLYLGQVFQPFILKVPLID